ncbi:BA75_04370T0 [Komagataella pastoris]|uniref:Protein phosphatase n=1 Tax=Komagataella pastoris TaxID=4922 RepID=A0A1B2JH05_PICPA|nr:BA75_04370T0 [Komagataella pastoris]
MFLGGCDVRLCFRSLRQFKASQSAYFKIQRVHVRSFTKGSTGSGGSTGTGGFESSYRGSKCDYNIAVSYLPKDRFQENEDGELLQMLKDKLMEQKAKGLTSPTGEDNYVCSLGRESIAVGVADGVGGWSELGHDSSEISRVLCRTIESFHRENEKMEPQQLIDSAFSYIKENEIVKVGGTTICLGILDWHGAANVANLGDSWFGVFRQMTPGYNFECVHQSLEQQHFFNAPFQLALIPNKILEDGKSRNAKYIVDSPDDAELYHCQLEHGDIILFATDGITDNVSVDDLSLFLTDKVAEFRKGATKSTAVDSKTLLAIGMELTSKVNKLSLDETYPSVFAQRLSHLTRMRYMGGKYDDITCVLVYVD